VSSVTRSAKGKTRIKKSNERAVMAKIIRAFKWEDILTVKIEILVPLV
jgi:hypothetical protein